MLRIRFTISFLLVTLSLSAKQSDTLFAQIKHEKFVLAHKVKDGESLFSISKMYHAPPAVVSDINSLSYQSQLKKDDIIDIPLDDYNYIITTSTEPGNAKGIYYTVSSTDNLPSISRTTGAKQREIQEWNKLPDNSIHSGQVLMLGWVSYDKTQAPAKNATVKVEKNHLDTKRKKNELPDGIRALLSDEEIAAAEAQAQKEIHFSDSISPEEELFLSQSNHGMYTTDDKGTAVFFDMPGKVKNSKYYAFHNMAKRGTIMRVFNPGTNKTVYAKVLGPIPDNSKYYNCILGISAGAKKMLGVSADKMWCEISYAP